MTPIPAPSRVFPQEEWADTDFDLPEGVPLNTQSDAESDSEMEDWDVELNLGKTGGAKVSFSSTSLASVSSRSSGMMTIKAPLPSSSDEDDFDDEGASTIKLSHMPLIRPKTPPRIQEEDIEKAFDLPSDLTQLSLRPLELRHRQSKSSLEWGDKDHTGSSTSSDAYSTFGFGNSASPSSNSTSAPSIGELETDDDDDDEAELEGIVFPTGIFDSRNGGRQLAKILEDKKRLPLVNERAKPTRMEEDDFEIGLIIDDDFDLSPSRLPSNRHQASQEKKPFGRSKSAPAARPTVTPFRPSSRLAATKDRPKSPIPSTSTGVSRVRPLVLSQPTSTRPTLTRKSTMQTLSVAPPSAFCVQSPISSSLRAQKSHQVLKPPSPRSTMARKASLSSLIDTAAAAAMPPAPSLQSPTSYAAPTAASRARSHAIQAQFSTQSSYYPVPPTRPTTPSTSTAALRLTMPTSSSRAKIRPAISSVFSGIGPSKDKEGRLSPSSRPSSTVSSGSSRSPPHSPPLPTGPKILKRPKKARTYGDGTELDGIEDLPTDRDREIRYRVTPKAVGAPRLGNSKPTEKVPDVKGTIGRKTGLKRDSDTKPSTTTSTGTLRRKDRVEFGSKSVTPEPLLPRKVARKKPSPKAPTGVSTGTTRRKPTLIRNLGGVGSPKVVGDMKWNPQTLRWEGNEQVLRDFDAVTASSTRPALITHLTGSSIGSPVGMSSFAAAGARVVGNMVFDPNRMCWISRLPPDEDEPDPFADMADDEDDWESRAGTIRAGSQDQSLATAATRGDTPSPGRPSSVHSRGVSETGSERGARPALRSLQDMDGKLLEKCRVAEDRHRAEMKGWKLPPSNEPDLAALFEIRQLATRQY